MPQRVVKDSFNCIVSFAVVGVIFMLAGIIVLIGAFLSRPIRSSTKEGSSYSYFQLVLGYENELYIRQPFSLVVSLLSNSSFSVLRKWKTADRLSVPRRISR